MQTQPLTSTDAVPRKSGITDAAPKELAKPMVSIRGLTKTYGRNGRAVTALKDISLSIRHGEFVALLGPSGVGKSTLLRCLNHLVPPTSGDVVIGGENLAKLSKRQLLAARTRIGMIFQESNLIGRLPVITNVLCGRLATLGALRALTYSFPRDDYDRAVRALRRAGLDDEELYLRRADRLSGGQKQRVGIARMLVQQPDLVLADEPIASLDVKMQATIMDLIRGIARDDGITVVMSLHQLQVARAYATRIIALSAGGVAFDGPPGDLSDSIVQDIFDIDDEGLISGAR
ncbi:phosphonate transport system ATP-binding protein [Natronocella acetinitrilica]|uniref:Phosphonate transport system ATP-binding protein n=1 Tax=Natronocella acetinitrilica TaxID=414046 RepID=A0AAE3G7F9_9GAMM|nr:phosphonate ABC transporter ATP-binding protein [Natronocella acetinitrilica]MCP1676448.1 phosphonate transport system ATP-binding protein [Natronocella acetinitrilica]